MGCGAGKIILLVVVGALMAGCDPPLDVPPDYDAMYRLDRIVRWRLVVSRENQLQLLVTPEEYVEADLEVDGRQYPRVGLRFMGSNRRPKRSMRIRFNAFDPWQRFHGVKRINLRATTGDPSLVREMLGLTLMRRSGIAAPRSSLVTVNLNGAVGVYTLVEQVDRKFLSNRFGENDGNLYKLERGGTLRYVGENPGDYDSAIYELKTDDRGDGRGDLIELARRLDQVPDDGLEASLNQVLAIDEALDYFAATAWTVNLDSYPGTGDNLYLYRDEAGRFHPIPWDLNQAFANYHGTSCELSTDQMLDLDPFAPTCGGSRPLVDRCLRHPALRLRYQERLKTLMEGPLQPGRVQEEAELLHALVSEAAFDDELMEFSLDEFEAALEQDTPPGDNPERVPALVPLADIREARCRRALENG